MAYSDSFPSVRPSFMFSADAGRLDPRISYSRSTTGTYFGTEKVLGSENLLPYSENSGLWSQSGLLSRTGGQTDPAGGSTGFTLIENSAGGFHRLYQDVDATGDLAFTVFSKQNSGTRYLSLTLFNANNDWVAATFDLAGSAPATGSGSSSSFSGLTATQTASGDGYYKCVIKATGSITSVRASLNNTTSAPIGTYGLPSYTGDGSSSIDVSFSSLSTTGATDYSFTNGQIAREYQTKLQTAAINAPRFEHSATDSASEAVGQSRGLLIEGSSTNLLNYSEQFDNAYWSKSTGGTSPAINLTITPNAGIAPSGELTADLVVPQNTGGNTLYYIAKTYSFTSGNTYTLSVFVKAAGMTQFTLAAGNTGTWAASAQFTLTGDGSASVSSGSAQIEKCGNGWFRLSITGTAGATTSTNLLLQCVSGGQNSFDGDDYSGVLLWGAQMESASHPSSYIKVEGSTVTRASDSASMVSSSLFDNGGGTLYAEASRQAQNTYNGIFSVDDGSGSNIVQMFGNITNFRAEIASGGTTVANMNAAGNTVNTFHKHCLSFSPSEAKYFVNGSQIDSTDTDLNIPTMSQIHLGELNTSGNHLNGHIKRVAVYSEPVSATNAAALTS